MKEPATPFPDEREDRNERLISRVAHLQVRVGPFSEPFDMKAFLDEEWDAPKGDFSKTGLVAVEDIENRGKPLDTTEG